MTYEDLRWILELADKNLKAMRDTAPLFSYPEIVENLIAYQAYQSIVDNANPDNAPVSESKIKQLEQFLEKRWQRIRNKSLDYTQNYTNGTNKWCLDLAKLLASKTKRKSAFEYLIPTLTHTKSPITLTFLSETDLEIVDFVVSDDGRSLIPVGDALEFAEEDGVLKHPFILSDQNKPIKLSENEQKRVIYHNELSQAYYNAIIARVDALHDTKVMGGLLKSLVEKLREGGVHQKGTEFEAGQSANVAIHKFFEIYYQLPDNERKRLNQLCNGTQEKYLGLCLARLRFPAIRENETDLSEIYCVEVIANDIEFIIEANQTLLYDWPLKQTDTLRDLSSFEHSLESARNDFRSLGTSLAKVTPSNLPAPDLDSFKDHFMMMDENEINDFLEKLAPFMTKGTHVHQTMKVFKLIKFDSTPPILDEKLKTLIKTIGDFISLIDVLIPYLHDPIIEALIHYYAASMIKNQNDFFAVFNKLPKDLQGRFVECFDTAHIRHIFPYQKGLFQLMEKLPQKERYCKLIKPHWHVFFDRLMPFRSNSGLINILQSIPDTDQISLINALSFRDLSFLISNFNQFKGIVAILPESAQNMLVQKLYKRIKYIVKNHQQLTEISTVLSNQALQNLILTLNETAPSAGFTKQLPQLAGVLKAIPLENRQKLIVQCKPSGIVVLLKPDQPKHFIDKLSKEKQTQLLSFLDYEASLKLVTNPQQKTRLKRHFRYIKYSVNQSFDRYQNLWDYSDPKTFLIQLFDPLTTLFGRLRYGLWHTREGAIASELIQKINTLDPHDFEGQITALKTARDQIDNQSVDAKRHPHFGETVIRLEFAINTLKNESREVQAVAYVNTETQTSIKELSF